MSGDGSTLLFDVDNALYMRICGILIIYLNLLN